MNTGAIPKHKKLTNSEKKPKREDKVLRQDLKKCKKPGVEATKLPSTSNLPARSISNLFLDASPKTSGQGKS